MTEETGGITVVTATMTEAVIDHVIENGMTVEETTEIEETVVTM